MVIIPDILLTLALIIYLVLVRIKKVRFRLTALVLWLGAVLLVDTVITYSKIDLGAFFTFMLVLVLGSWLISYLIIHKDKRRLLTGYVFNLSIVITIGYIVILCFPFSTPLPIILTFVIGIMAFVLMSFGGYALIIYLLWNAHTVWKKESRSLGNMLTLLLGIAGLLLILFQHFLLKDGSIFAYIYMVIAIFLIYYFFSFMTILTSSLLFNHLKPKFDQDYLIVLGAGLINGETVTPLLAGRIDAALTFAKEQLARTGKQPLLIMSGGQGQDEKLPEAVAMENYALSQGMLKSEIITEENSKTTLQNLQFSKALMDERSQGKPYHSTFVSNDYHIFRAGLFAKKVGLKSEGLGSRTARYFLPNAFIREFVAIILMHKKRHIAFTVLLLILIAAVIVINVKFVG